MTRKAFLEGLRGGPPLVHTVSVTSPGNLHLIACICGHEPDEHDQQAGCIALAVDDGIEDFCPCTRYQVQP